ncbi:MAG: SPOR domain-containing protein [Bacteroidaceae bacterium]|nr:SPOR domain-containing protein [Bacteroidaceae bacterium]
MKIEKYIEKLLLSHDCVIIPGLGGFVARYEPSYRDDEVNMFYPPTRTLGFNAQLRMNDGLLAQTYMQTYDTNYPEACRLIENEAEKIKTALRQEGSYRFENIGRLELKSNQSLLFTPENESGIAAPDLYGLDAFMAGPYQKAVEEAPAEEEIAEPIAKQPEAESQEAPAEEEKSHYVIRLNKALMRYAAAAVIALIVFFSFSIPIGHNGEGHQQQLSAMNGALYGFPLQGMQQPNALHRVAEPDSQATTGVTTESKAEITEDPPTDTTAQPTTAEKEDYFTLVLASSISKKNAESYVEKLQQRGHAEASVYINENGMVRVVFNRYATMAQAYNALNRMAIESDDFTEAWVLHVH